MRDDDENLIMTINNHGADQDLNNYKDIAVGETYELEYGPYIPEDQRPSPDRWRLFPRDEGEVIELDDDDSPKKALMRFMLEEGDENTESKTFDVWVEFSDIKAPINYSWAADDSQADYDNDVMYLQSELEERFGEPPWLLNFEAENVGWDHRSGVLNNQRISTAEEFLARIVPSRTEWYARIYKWEQREDDEDSALIPGIRAVVSDHDSMGSLYYVLPVRLTAKQREEAKRIIAEDFILPSGATFNGEVADEILLDELAEGYSVSEAVANIAYTHGWEKRRSAWETLFDYRETHSDLIELVALAARMALADHDIAEAIHLYTGAPYQYLDRIRDDLGNAQPDYDLHEVMDILEGIDAEDFGDELEEETTDE